MKNLGWSSIPGNGGVYVHAKTKAAIVVYVGDMLLLSSPRDTDALWRDLARKVDYEDPAVPFFGLSWKAGGTGLNLTAADYIYILDPWWNPAVEAQAVDRAHRIGQTRRVFAYRLIAKDTVEEKILALQDRKRELADSIVRADESLIGGLTPEDVELLLS